MTQNSDDPVIRCEGVWKVFGQRANEALEAVKNGGKSKAEIRDQYDCVVGVQDASFEVGRGEIFCRFID